MKYVILSFSKALVVSTYQAQCSLLLVFVFDGFVKFSVTISVIPIFIAATFFI